MTAEGGVPEASHQQQMQFPVMADWSRSFKEAYCERYRCSPGRFVIRVFKKGLYRRARLIGPILMVFSPRLFQLDIDLINELGGARNWGDFNAIISNHVQSSHLRSGFLRNALKLRVSCQRLKRIATKLFGRRQGVREPEFRNTAIEPADIGRRVAPEE
ncbi:MAG: hypothetical protein KDM81_17825 [Verrucomicrobiae bacterium]|nr:hypothetical protein [Verrucomicrobiae bacterium]